MKFILSVLLMAAVFAASPDAEEHNPKVLVRIMRPKEKHMRYIVWDVSGLNIDGQSIQSILLEQPESRPPNPQDKWLEEETFVANPVIDDVLREFPKALESGKGLLHQSSSQQPTLGKDDMDYFKAEKWFWWIDHSLSLESYYYHNKPPCGHVWLTFCDKTFEGHKNASKIPAEK